MRYIEGNKEEKRIEDRDPEPDQLMSNGTR
jgi:hypothetical protein